MISAIPLLVIPFILFNLGLTATPAEGGGFGSASFFDFHDVRRRLVDDHG
jgi:hypothetical protein